MSAVTHLTQYLIRLEPSKNVARQTLFNYIKVFSDPSTPLSADLFNQFFSYVLNYQYWQQNAKSLGETLRQDLERFSHEYRLDFDLNAVSFPHQSQIVVLDHPSDVEHLIAKRDLKLEEEGDRRRIVPISETQTLSVTLKRRGTLQVRVYGRAAIIRSGELHMIRPVSELHYNSNLELEHNQLQLLEGPMVTAARFHVTSEGCQGTMVRGHMLQRYETLNSGPLINHAELFYSLKRLERHYVNPSSDPFHRELVSQLERVQQMLQSHNPDGRRLANGAVQRAKTALKHIFPNDKQITVLVTNIEFSLMPQGQVTDPWTPPPNL